MPLSNIQSAVLSILASHRDPESYVAGGTPLNLHAPRYSSDIDVFHDREERVSEAARADSETLRAAGYQVSWLRQLPLIYTASIARGDEATRLEWVVDSDFRFFPTVPDEVFGYVLHPVDLATNKVMAAAGRREVRDLIDLMTIHDKVLSLGAVVWAAAEKAPGFTPEGLIAEIRRNSQYPLSEWRAINAEFPIDADDITVRLRAALDESESFAARMPTTHAGLIFLEDGRAVQPDPSQLGNYSTHSGRRRGHWPASAEITAAMLERLQRTSTFS